MGPRSLEISGAVADGTVLCEAHGPTEIAAALDRIRVGQAAESRGPEHRVTVFAAFHVGDEADIVRNPDAPVGWEAVSDDPARVAESITSLFDAGADSAVLVPLATDPRAALVEASRSVIPLVREHLR